MMIGLIRNVFILTVIHGILALQTSKRAGCGGKICSTYLMLAMDDPPQGPGSKYDRPFAQGKPLETKELLNKDWEFQSIKDVRFKLIVNDEFVPVVGSNLQRGLSDKSPLVPFATKRRQMFEAGLYPGVEYRIKRIFVRDNAVRSLLKFDPQGNLTENERYLQHIH